MPVSTRKKLDGNLPEFLEDVNTKGVWGAMEKWGIKDYLGVRKIIVEETGDESCGLNRTNATYMREGIRGLFQEFVDAFASKIIAVDRENKTLRSMLEAYKNDAGRFERDLAGGLSDMIAVLKK